MNDRLNDRLIITLPINPYNQMHVGKMTTPILGETLAKTMHSKFVMSINQLSTYSERNYESFLKLMDAYNIKPYEYWIDSKNIDALLDKIYYLIKKKYIVETEKKIMTCDCGKIDILLDHINTINMADSLFEIKEGKCYCKFCKSLCQIEKRKVLVFQSSMVDKSGMKFYPNFINKDKKTFDNTIGKNEILISKQRETRISIVHNYTNYNLDIDFIWEVFLSLFNEKEKIVLCCNHQLYQLYLVGMLEKCFNQDSNTVCLATPYLEKSAHEDLLKERVLSLKLFAILSLKWANKENKFDPGLLRYLNSMNVNKKEMLYDLITSEIETTGSMDKDLAYVLTKKYNFQNANTELKRRRKDV